MATKDLRINNGIRVKEVRLINENGEQMGIVATDKALAIAEEAGLDLVEVAPTAKPPVCKLLDYGKYKFDQEKLTKESKKRSKQKKDKEIRMQPTINDHDLLFKVKHVQEFLEHGCKVKVTIRFRGREMAHTERGKDVLEKILSILENVYTVERNPKLEGRFMSMLLKPKSKKEGK
ncbi:MAG: translation initiation factor IF-3 [Spirochaetales bacterium]|nr:translation initiation factor IF-3 [Spirochaetales bacterium]